MPGQDEIKGGLPDLLRDSNRPIIIYQGAPSPEQQTGSALRMIAWLALLSGCVVAAGMCFWSVWNPASDPRQESLVYEAGRPLGLARQIEERKEINERAAGLFEYLDRVRIDNIQGRSTSASPPPVLVDRDGIDDLRRDWDAMCLSIRQRIYDRRIGRVEGRLAEIRQRRAQSRDPGELARLDAELAVLQRQRGEEIVRLDRDPDLRCIPAAQATACSDMSSDLWCNPEHSRATEFVRAPDDKS